MKHEQVRLFQQRRPFEPFAIHLADARYFEVRHPDAVSLPPVETRSLAVLNKDRLTEVIDLLMIVSLRPLTPDEIKNR
jgi:hypothetical protein